MKKSIVRLMLCITLIFITRSVMAKSFAVEAGEKDINLVYANTEFYGDVSPLRLDGQLLYSKQNDHQDLLASVGLTAFTGGINGFEFGAGIKIVAADPLDYYLSAIAVGAELAYRPATTPEFKFETSLYYAGEALTFSDGDNIEFLVVNMDYEMASDIFIRLGYRSIKAELKNELTTDFDRGIYLGLAWTF